MTAMQSCVCHLLVMLTSEGNVPHMEARCHQLPNVPLFCWLKVEHLHSPSDLGKLRLLIQTFTFQGVSLITEMNGTIATVRLSSRHLRMLCHMSHHTSCHTSRHMSCHCVQEALSRPAYLSKVVVIGWACEIQPPQVLRWQAHQHAVEDVVVPLSMLLVDKTRLLQ